MKRRDFLALTTSAALASTVAVAAGGTIVQADEGDIHAVRLKEPREDITDTIIGQVIDLDDDIVHVRSFDGFHNFELPRSQMIGQEDTIQIGDFILIGLAIDGLHWQITGRLTPHGMIE